jgi:hypothetical protein
MLRQQGEIHCPLIHHQQGLLRGDLPLRLLL